MLMYWGLVHIGTKQDHVQGVETFTVKIQECHDFEGSYLHVKGVGILQIVVPNLVNHVMEKLGTYLFGCIVTGIVFEF